MSVERRGRMRGWALPLGALTATVLFPAATRADAAADAALDMELRYIDALSKSGYVDFAPEVIAAAQKKWPDAKGVLEAASFRAQLEGGKQEEVAKKIAARPDQNSLDTWLLKLELAKSYYRYGKFNDADKLYAEFFKRFPKVQQAAKKTFVEAAYLYIDLLGKIDRQKDALAYYKLAMDQAPSDDLRYNLRAQYLQALLAQAESAQGAERENLLKEADGLANQMVWRQDNYFGDAINGLAHVKMLRGDTKGAQEMIKDYLDTLMTIHESYKKDDPDGSKGWLRMSPLPQCRYLIGSMLLDQAKAEIAKPTPNEELIKNYLLGERDPKTKKRNGQGALNHLINVYVNYPESQSASSAGEMANEIVKIIQNRYETTVKFSTTPEQDAKVRQAQFVEADVKFDSGDWEGAAEAFSQVISRYGLNRDALPRLRKMVESYVRAGAKGNALDPMAKLNAETVTMAVAEGFSGVEDESLRTAAGNTLSNIADFYGEAGLVAMQEETNKAFFRFYPGHPNAVSRQLNVAKKLAEAGNAEEAAKIYQQVADAASDEAQRDIRTAALVGLIELYNPRGAKPDVALEMQAAQAFADHFKGIARPGINAAAAQNYLAVAYMDRAESLRKSEEEGAAKRMMADYAMAAKIFTDLSEELSKPENIYVSTSTERERAANFLETALYQRAVCMQRLPATGQEARDKAIKARALTYFQDYLKRFPKGRLAPHAMLQIGTLQAASGDIEASRETLATLAKTFPTSEQAKNSIPLLADSLFRMGMRSEATNTYKQMFAAGGTYTPSQYLAAASALFDAGESDLAVEACDCVLKAKGAAAYRPQAMLLRTRALLAGKKTADAYKQVEELLKQYGRTTVAIDANLLLIDVIGEQILNVKTLEDRNKLIKEAKDAVSFITSQRKDDATAVRLNLAVAKVADKAYRATVSANAEKVDQMSAAGSALNAYRAAMFSGRTERTDPSVSLNIQEAYLGYITLSQERAKLSEDKEERADFQRDIVDLGEEYLKTFPDGKYKTEITNAVTLARIEIGG